ncbi:hypothetical protein OpiT1DRAFT_03503 [Opitutaceae bacterium TAV1]|nr:hypothetical protein OpiT1DRAFT_03503 [Opitutaceae bacterium TAV1]
MSDSFESDYYGALLVSARIARWKWSIVSLVVMGIVAGIFAVTLLGIADDEARSAGLFAGAMACLLTICPLAFCLAAVGDVINASRELERLASRETGENDEASVTVFPLQASRAGTPAGEPATVLQAAATESAAAAKMAEAATSDEASAVAGADEPATPATALPATPATNPLPGLLTLKILSPVFIALAGWSVFSNVRYVFLASTPFFPRDGTFYWQMFYLHLWEEGGRGSFLDTPTILWQIFFFLGAWGVRLVHFADLRAPVSDAANGVRTGKLAGRIPPGGRCDVFRGSFDQYARFSERKTGQNNNGSVCRITCHFFTPQVAGPGC